MGLKVAWRELLIMTGQFLKMGAISFGGPAAGYALMEQEVVRKRGWLNQEQFLELLAITNLIPGPNVVEMAIHIGYVRAGWLGLFTAGAAYIFPAFIISLAFSWVYVQFSSLPAGKALFYGINPVAMAIILTATYRMGKTALKGKIQLGICAIAFLAALLRVNEVIILLAAGIAGILSYAPPAWLKNISLVVMPVSILNWGNYISRWNIWFDEKLVMLGLFFLKVGALLFGSGMVLFAFIQQDVVNRYGWLTQQQLIDAIAVGQMTPGPVLSSATFIGYMVSGLPGAIVATIAVFLPAFIIVILIRPVMPRLKQSQKTQAFLKGVNAAVVALILVVSLALFQAAIVDLWTILILIIGLVLLLRFSVDTFWLVLGGALLGYLHTLFY